MYTYKRKVYIKTLPVSFLNNMEYNDTPCVFVQGPWFCVITFKVSPVDTNGNIPSCAHIPHVAIVAKIIIAGNNSDHF